KWIARISAVSGASLVLPEAIDTRRVGLQLLVLGVAVVAEAVLHCMVSAGVGNIHPGLIVFCGVVPGAIASLLLHAAKTIAIPTCAYVLVRTRVREEGIRSPVARRYTFGRVCAGNDVAVPP